VKLRFTFPNTDSEDFADVQEICERLDRGQAE